MSFDSLNPPSAAAGGDSQTSEAKKKRRKKRSTSRTSSSSTSSSHSAGDETKLQDASNHDSVTERRLLNNNFDTLNKGNKNDGDDSFSFENQAFVEEEVGRQQEEIELSRLQLENQLEEVDLASAPPSPGQMSAGHAQKTPPCGEKSTSRPSSPSSPSSPPSQPPPFRGREVAKLFGFYLPFLDRFITVRWLLAFLSLSAIVQGMIFTNVVISSIERRFGLHSTQSGVIAGSYDLGSLLAVIPVTYFGGRPGASKPKYIAAGMFVMGSGSLLFASPHFFTGRYIDEMSRPDHVSVAANESFLARGLCRHQGNASVDGSCVESSDDLDESMTWCQWVFISAQLLHGIGAAALVTLGTTLMDESAPSKASAPMYIGLFEAMFILGPALGYVVGGRLLNIFTEFYLLSSEPESSPAMQLTVDSAKWIGAWWLGFLIILALSYLCALILAMFPPVLPNARGLSYHHDPGRQSAPGGGTKKSGVVQPTKDRDYVGLLKALPNALHELLSNATYMLVSLGATMDGFLLAGMAAFLPKYFESQFSLSPGNAATLVGTLVVPAGAGGTLIGGYAAKRLRLTRAGTIKMYILCQCIVLPLYLGFVTATCDGGDFAGVTTTMLANNSHSTSAGEGRDFVTGVGGGMYADCNANCACDRGDFDPVCAGGVTYFSACYAGCSAVTVGSSELSQKKKVFSGCTCLPDETEGLAVEGLCPRALDCDYKLFAVFLFLQVFFTFAATMPGLMASLRSVEPSQRSLSLGLQTILLRGLGTIPGPIIFGYLMDQTCLLWRNEECSTSDSSGSCLVYDNWSMNVYVLAVVTTWRLVGAVFFAVALYFNRTCNVKDESEDAVVDKC